MGKKMEVSQKTNKELMLSVLDLIESYGYHIKDKVIGNCYFIFEGEDDSICHFHIKEIPGFLFGLWHTSRYGNIKDLVMKDELTWADSLEIDSKSEIIFFTQYERDLDKFKPSRSGFVTGLYRRAWDECPNNNKEIIHKEEWCDYELVKILYFMKHHRMRSAIYAGRESKFVWESETSHLSIIKEFIEDWLYHWKYELRDYLKLQKQIKVSKKLAKSLKYSYCFIIDRGSSWTPRIDIFIRRKPDVDLIAYNKEQVKIDKFEDKYFDVSLYQFDIDLTVEDLTDEDLKKDKKLYDEYKDKLEYFSKELAEMEEDEPDVERTKIIYSNIKGCL